MRNNFYLQKCKNWQFCKTDDISNYFFFWWQLFCLGLWANLCDKNLISILKRYSETDLKGDKTQEHTQKNVPNLCPQIKKDDVNGILRRFIARSLQRS